MPHLGTTKQGDWGTAGKELRHWLPRTRLLSLSAYLRSLEVRDRISRFIEWTSPDSRATRELRFYWRSDSLTCVALDARLAAYPSSCELLTLSAKSATARNFPAKRLSFSLKASLASGFLTTKLLRG